MSFAPPRRNGMRASAIGEKQRTRVQSEADVAEHRKKNLPNGWPAQYQPEAAFQKQVEEAAHSFGWMTSHSHLPFFDTAGTPDLLLVHPSTGRTVFAELKVATKAGRLPKPSPAQQRWLSALALHNEVYIWTWPMDWDSLVETLRGQV